MILAIKYIRYTWLFLSFFLFSFLGYSQKKTIPLLTDSLLAEERLTFIIDSLQGTGYLEATLESWSQPTGDSLFYAKIHLGPIYQWIQLDVSRLPEDLRNRIESDIPKEAAVTLNAWLALKERILDYAEDHGYPFARVRLRPILSEKKDIKGIVEWEPGPYYFLDTLQIMGEGQVNRFFLQSYLGLQPGQPFRQQQLEEADQRLNDLPFLKRDQATAIRFQDNRAAPIFYVSNQKASRFDFIIGVLPNSQQTRRLLVTADLEAELQNAFGKGERLYAKFEQLRPETQELQLAIDYPYLLKLPFGTSIDFGLHKRDTSFLDVEWEFGLQYLMSAGNHIQFFWRQEQSRLLAIDQHQLEQSQSLPERLDLRQTLFGIEYNWQNFDYRFNPRRGWAIKSRSSTGNKQILRNSEIEAIGLGNLYDSLDNRQLQFRLELQVARHWPLFGQSTLRLAANSGFIFSEGTIYQNEQFRLGGNRLLRGFDEAFFFADGYVIGTLEYRLLISQNSYLFTFVDNAWLENGGRSQRPLGFGAGISLETRSGLFGLSLAYGKTQDIPIDFTSPKVHFGYVSLF